MNPFTFIKQDVFGILPRKTVAEQLPESVLTIAEPEQPAFQTYFKSDLYPPRPAKQPARLRSFTRLKPSKLNRVSPKQRARSSAWSITTAAAIAAVKGRCPVQSEWCINRATAGHHKLPRSQGGLDEQGNCLACCRGCHRWIHAHPALAYAAGYLRKADKRIGGAR